MRTHTAVGRRFLRRLTTPIAVIALASAGLLAPGTAGASTGPDLTAWRAAQFGMFVHWGLYAVPAGTWKGTYYPNTSEWIMADANIPVAEYEALARSFNPTRFSAKAWVAAAKSAGMKYIVVTAKHHDGFAMWPSEVTNFDIEDRTKFGRRVDWIDELARESRSQGMLFGIYYSILDWHHPAFAVNPDPPCDDRERDDNGVCPAKYGTVFKVLVDKVAYVSYMNAQLRELIARYQPSVLWFDGNWFPNWTCDDGQQLYDFLRSISPRVVMNDRLGPSDCGIGDFVTQERMIPERPPARFWESEMTMNDNWGYNAGDNNWKSPWRLVLSLAKVRATGGNFLLNVGPTAQGVIPAPSVEILCQIGWLRRIFGV